MEMTDGVSVGEKTIVNRFHFEKQNIFAEKRKKNKTKVLTFDLIIHLCSTNCLASSLNIEQLLLLLMSNYSNW